MPDNKTETVVEITNPRISWSVILMGIGIIASVVLNYAAYGTRIAVLEANSVIQDKAISQLTSQLSASLELLHTVHVNSEADRRDLHNIRSDVQRIRERLDKINKNKKED